MIKDILAQSANIVLLSFVVGIPLWASIKRINVFDCFVVGAKDGFDTVLKILPYLVGMIVSIGMLRASGFFATLSDWLSPLLSKLGMPTELLPLALIRPFSGSAANGMMAELIHQHGGDSLIAKMAATLMGSTETTFYVIAVYFGTVGIYRTRYAIVAGLLADLTGIIAAVVTCRWYFG